MATDPIILPQTPLVPTAVEPPVLEVLPTPKKKSRATLAILIVLFLITYALVLTVIVYQGITINSQRLLILDLFRDSAQLNAYRMKENQKHQAAPPADKGKAKPQDKTPQDKAQAAKPKQRMRQLQPPQVPDNPDVTDTRRVQISI